MASQTSKILIAFQAQKDQAVVAAFKKIGRESRTLEKNFTTLSDKGIKKIRNEFNKMAQGSATSLQAMRAQKNALMGLRDQADVTGLEFKQLTADINRLDRQMRKAGTGATGFKGRLKGFAKGAGAIAAGGIFGGPEGAIGAGIGGIIGGAPGALTGAAVGAQVGMLRQSIAETASYSAGLRLQREALNLVIGDTEKYTAAQKFLSKTSESLAIPQDVITRQFTSLTASVKGAGKSTEDAQEVFEAIAAGIRGTGGTLEDMKAAMRATSQVFSKGKVSAEELRQQLGERLPGAFTLFAKSMDKTPQELDKALEQGKVTLDDFMKFAKELTKEYGENAKILASGPAAAGDRLKTAMSKLRDNLGTILGPIGASFQDTFTVIVKVIDSAVVGLKNFLKLGEEFEKQKLADKTAERDALQTEITRFKKMKENDDALMKSIRERQKLGEKISRDELFDAGTAQKRSEMLTIKLKNLGIELKDLNIDIGVIQTSIDRMNISVDNTEDSTKNLGNTSANVLQSMKSGMMEYANSIKDVNKQISDATVNAFKGMEDALVNFVLTGKLSFSSLARSILADLTRMIVRQQIFNALSGFQSNFINPFSPKGPADNIADFMGAGRSLAEAQTIASGGFVETVIGPNAVGNAFAKNGIVPYRNGGVVGSPTMFQYGGSNLGIMGEAGPEAILPLQRGKGGKLGVQSSGGVGNIVVNVDASGSSVEGNSQQSAELGKMLGAVVQAELIKQKRPGGLLG